MKKILPVTLLICTLLNALLYGQEKLSVNDDFSKHHYYKISNEQARQIYKGVDIQFDDTSFFKTPVDYTNQLPMPTGNYIDVRIKNDRLNYEYAPVTPWHIYVLNNNIDLIIRFIDNRTDQPVKVDNVKLKNRSLQYDTVTKTYLLKAPEKDGNIEVTDQGFKFYYSVRIGKNDRNIGSYSNLNSVLFYHPLGYFTKPFLWASLSQITTANLFREKEYYDFSFSDIWDAIKYTYTSRFTKKANYKSYFYFNKPIYREGDTVKFKAFVFSRAKEDAATEPMMAYLYRSYNDSVLIGKTSPKHPGAGYDFQFVLSDSLNLKLDKSYNIQIRNSGLISAGNSRFDYEDYELKKAVFQIDLPDGTEQTNGKPFFIHFDAKDENGLPMPDTRASVYIISKNVDKIIPDQLFIRDTLWAHHFTINRGDDKLQIPDSIFPEANINYTLHAVMQNSENERTDIKKEIAYKLNRNPLKIEITKDSVYITESVRNNALLHISADDFYDYPILDTMVKCPYSAPLNSSATYYYAESKSDKTTLNVEGISPGIVTHPHRTSDSLFCSVTNPRKIPFIYHLYLTDKEIKRGTQDDLPLAMAAQNDGIYYIILEFIWAGRTRSVSDAIPFLKNIVHLNVDQPAIITPGKETTISIKATDYLGNPVKDLSVLGYGYTKKFNVEPPSYLPPLGLHYRSRRANDKYKLFLSPDSEFDDYDDDESDYYDTDNITLNYQYWNGKMKLDTNWMYRFRYPGQSIEPTIVPAEDSITQFAPFVVEKGTLQPVHYVLMDEVPVYFGFTDIKLPYSFATDTSYHTIKVRIGSRLVTLDSIKVRNGFKTIFSIDPDTYTGKNMQVTFLPDTFTKQELGFLTAFIMKIDMPKNILKYSYLEHEYDINQYIDLSDISKTGYNSKNTIGPIYWKGWHYCNYGDYNFDFIYEPYYAYTFENNKLKMKSTTREDLIGKRIYSPIPSINDEVCTKKELFHSYESALMAERLSRNLYDFGKSDSGNATIKLDYDLPDTQKQPVNIILGQSDNFNLLKVFSGNTKDIRKIPPGKYQLLLIYGYNEYRKTSVFDVKENGTTFFRITEAETVNDSSANRINNLLNDLYKSPSGTNEAELNALMKEYVHATYKGPSFRCTGHIYFNNKEEAIGALVKISGTTIGTMTDIDGAFEIDVPENSSGMIEVSYTGFNTVTVKAEKELKISLSESNNTLQEVVITTPYGPPVTKEKYIGAASIVTTNSSLSASDITKALEGAAPGVAVSGTSLQLRGRGSLSSSTQPLIVLNGAPFDGDLSEIDPEIVASMSVLKDTMSTSLYGSRGANGVLIITTKDGANIPQSIKRNLGSVSPAMSEEMMVSSLRNNFHDDAFWEPNLVTDTAGMIRFTVKFPDDITNWQTYYIAADNKLHTGKAEGNIKSFKPISASLFGPRFLTTGDTAYLIGKSVNYIPDSIAAKTSFSVNDALINTQNFLLGPFSNDTIRFVAPGGDPVKLKYILTKEDGYFDGEEKMTPLQPVGIKISKGSFAALDAKDTAFTIYPIRNEDSLHITATASLTDVLLNEIEEVRSYGYLCNEQMASKVIAMVHKEKLYDKLGKEIGKKDRKYTQDLINKLIKNCNEDNQWGWWDKGSSVKWISDHVRLALIEAKTMKYKVDIDLSKTGKNTIFELENDTTIIDVTALEIMAKLDEKVDYEKYIGQMERNRNITLAQRLDLILLRQKLHLPYKTELLKSFSKEDVYGNIYWSDSATGIYHNQILTTVKALNILQYDSGIDINKHKVINWLLKQRTNKGWRNTYESALIIDAISNTIPLKDTSILQPKLVLNGALTEEINRFPYHKTVLASSAIQVKKTGLSPVYLTWYNNYWDTSYNSQGNNFSVRTYFESNKKEPGYLTGGEPVVMKINIEVSKSADYVMVEVPIPAGCSYQEKKQSRTNFESYREYFEDKVSIFCQQLPKGNYTYEVELLPRYSGNYTINPAKAELMYFPIFFGRAQLKRISIK